MIQDKNIRHIDRNLHDGHMTERTITEDTDSSQSHSSPLDFFIYIFLLLFLSQF